MTSVTNITAAASPSPFSGTQAQSAPAPAIKTPAITAAPSSNDTSISPRIVDDPLAGQIIQVLNGTGQVQSQYPSATAVAYLRAGLTSQGFSKPQETDA